MEIASEQEDERLAENIGSLTKRYIDELARSSRALSEHAYVLSAILESIGVAVLVFNKEGRILLANKMSAVLAGRDLTNLTREDLRNIYQFYKNESKEPLPEEHTPYMKAVRDRQTSTAEKLITGGAIEPAGIWVSTTAAPIIGETGEFLGVVIVFSNISRRKRLEKQRDALASLITHDTKNHLASWNMLLEFFQIDALNLDEGQAEILSRLRQENQEYLTLTTTLLELFRTDFLINDSCSTEIDVEAILNSAIAGSAEYATALGVHLELSIDGKIPPIRGIPSAIRQGVHNLVQNSIEASSKDTHVEIHAWASDQQVNITVRDYGAGMSPEKVQDILDQCRVAASLPKGTRSTGFGLYLTRLLVESHGGRISCESKEGFGTTFTIELPSASPLDN